MDTEIAERTQLHTILWGLQLGPYEKNYVSRHVVFGACTLAVSRAVRNYIQRSIYRSPWAHVR